MHPARRLTIRGQVTSRSDANALLKAPGDAVVVHRGRLRSIAIACPDGCGEVLTINLDPEAGPSWRLYRDRRGVTMFPSVWRSSGCKSHFIVWSDRILWCETGADDHDEPAYDPSLEPRILAVLLSASLMTYTEIADRIGEIPWEVARACRELVRRKLLISGVGKQALSFKRVPSSSIGSGV